MVHDLLCHEPLLGVLLWLGMLTYWRWQRGPATKSQPSTQTQNPPQVSRLFAGLTKRGMVGIRVKTNHKREKACNSNNVTFSPWYVPSSFVRSFRVRTVRKGSGQPALLSPCFSEVSPSLKRHPRRSTFLDDHRYDRKLHVSRPYPQKAPLRSL
jgi:hypothetical protein